MQKVLGTNFYQSENLWVDSSPSNGLLSVEPYVKRWTRGSTAAAGDMHFYDYSMDCEVDSKFPEARFVSEFGFQSQPSFATYKGVLNETDYFKDSTVVAYRQRHEGGNEQMTDQITKHFFMPSLSLVPGEQGFNDYLYLTGIQQARCYETFINKLRRGRSEEAQSMGILYWQMNDIWQGASWASMEFGGRWKPLHYTVRRTYAPVISHLLKTSDDTFQLWFVNDEREDVTVSYVVEPVSWKGAKISESQKVSNLSVRIPANSSFMASQLNIKDLTGDVCDETTCFIKASAMAYKDDSANVVANNLSNTYLFLSQMKDA